MPSTLHSSTFFCPALTLTLALALVSGEFFRVELEPKEEPPFPSACIKATTLHSTLLSFSRILSSPPAAVAPY